MRPNFISLWVVLALARIACCDLAWAQEGAHGTPVTDADLQKFLQTLSFVSRRNDQYYKITTPYGIDEASYVPIGGIDQYISIRGEDRDNPVILFLHGGPGDATNPWGYLAFRSWLKYFTVVQWDQRGAGRTLHKSGPEIAPTLTVERMTEDGIELAAYLRKSLQKDKLILIGHSWGSVLGLSIAKARPDLFYAYVGTGQVADETRNYAVAYTTLLEKARALQNEIAIEELRAIGPPPYADYRGWSVQRKWSNLFEHSDLFISGMLGAALSAPGYTLADIDDWIAGQNLSAQQLIPQTTKLDSRALGGQFALPIFIIQGAEDFTTPTRLARTFMGSIRAPHKEFIAIPNAGHFAVFIRSDEFLRELLSRVRPLATNERTSSPR
jgi:pimeloyl-ACP methyl ester carboxylesterase